MSIHQIKVQPLTQKAFSQYGTCIDLPAEGDYELRSSDLATGLSSCLLCRAR